MQLILIMIKFFESFVVVALHVPRPVIAGMKNEIALVIGYTKSANRLKEKKALSVQPKRIAISNKILLAWFGLASWWWQRLR